jgi:hypothetical protein
VATRLQKRSRKHKTAYDWNPVTKSLARHPRHHIWCLKKVLRREGDLFGDRFQIDV